MTPQQPIRLFRRMLVLTPARSCRIVLDTMIGTDKMV
jgi:hypothetical protein